MQRLNNKRLKYSMQKQIFRRDQVITNSYYRKVIEDEGNLKIQELRDLCSPMP